MKNKFQVLLLSEVFLTIDFLDYALGKFGIPSQLTTTGSTSDALQKINRIKFQIVALDSYMMATISENEISQMIRLNETISFLLISYSEKEEDILNWFDFGFTDVVIFNNPLSLILSIKREIRNHPM
ncbi:MAG: hypothetical protein KBA66_12880 [Leptospiraceae bacterium]|nr:hypothetical protein [Leptospiraceae bacterium]